MTYNVFGGTVNVAQFNSLKIAAYSSIRMAYIELWCNDDMSTCKSYVVDYLSGHTHLTHSYADH